MEYTILSDSPTRKPVSFKQTVYRCALIITGLSITYLLSVLITGSAWLPLAGIEANSSELTLSIVQCLLGAAALHAPRLITKLTKVEFPDALCALFYIFVICGTVLGEVFTLFYTIPIWDSLLHLGSGVMSGMLGSILLVTYFENKKCDGLISPVFIATASICFALCIGVVWEFYEFAGDSFLGLNMQKFLLQDGSELIGQAALFDTMKDLIVDTAGAIVAAAASYISLKRGTGWIHNYRTDEIETAREVLDERQVLPHSA